MKLPGKENDLITEEGKLTKSGYIALLISSVFGMCLFLLGRFVYGRKKESVIND